MSIKKKWYSLWNQVRVDTVFSMMILEANQKSKYMDNSLLWELTGLRMRLKNLKIVICEVLMGIR